MRLSLFISQIMTSKTPVRSAEDVDEVTFSYTEIKAIATGNTLINEKMDIDVKLERPKMTKSEFLKAHEKLEHKIIHTYPHKIQDAEKFSIILKGKIFTDKKEVNNFLSAFIKKLSIARLIW